MKFNNQKKTSLRIWYIWPCGEIDIVEYSVLWNGIPGSGFVLPLSSSALRVPLFDIQLWPRGDVENVWFYPFRFSKTYKGPSLHSLMPFCVLINKRNYKGKFCPKPSIHFKLPKWSPSFCWHWSLASCTGISSSDQVSWNLEQALSSHSRAQVLCK